MCCSLSIITTPSVPRLLTPMRCSLSISTTSVDPSLCPLSPPVQRNRLLRGQHDGVQRLRVHVHLAVPHGGGEHLRLHDRQLPSSLGASGPALQQHLAVRASLQQAVTGDQGEGEDLGPLPAERHSHGLLVEGIKPKRLALSSPFQYLFCLKSLNLIRPYSYLSFALILLTRPSPVLVDWT